MAQKTGIAWTEATWNPLAGCKEISPGCTNCYAAVMAHRLEAMGQEKYKGTTRKLANGKVVWTGKMNLDPDALNIPLRRKKPTMYFVNSMSDLFHDDVPDEFVVKCFAVMLLAQRHTFQVLTKRPQRMRRIVAAPNFGECVYDMAFNLSHMMTCGGLMDHVPETDVLPNIWLGVSVEDQQRADERIPWLLKTPAAVRFLSVEPLLGPVSLSRWLQNPVVTGHPAWRREVDRPKVAEPMLHWVIVGGESGHGARPCKVDWIRSLVQQCQAAGVSCFVKQLGSDPVWKTWPVVHPETKDRLRDPNGGDPSEWSADLRVRDFPEVRV